MLVPPELVSTAVALISADPLTEGFHVQVAVNGEDVLVGLFLQPGITIFLTLNVLNLDSFLILILKVKNKE